MIKIWGTSFSLIGDLVISLPQLNYFKNKYKDIYVYFVIHKKISYCAPLFFNHPLIDKIHITGEWSSFNDSDYDIIIANRFCNQKILGNLGFFRSFVSLSTITLINLIFGKKTQDPLSGFFLFKKNILLKFEKSFFLNGYKILFDIIYNGKTNLVIGHQDIKFNKRKYEKSKFNLRIIVIFLRQLIYTKFFVAK